MALKSYLTASLLAAITTALQDIPPLGLGTWLSDRANVPHAVEFGLKNGYDHIDAAWIYRNEDQTGRGIAAANTPREDIWVTSKLWNTHHRDSEAKAVVQETLHRLGLEQLDLYLMHWPVAFIPGTTELDTSVSVVDTYKTMEDLVRANFTRHIGISNFAKKEVETILDMCEICPYAHEFETHPYLQQQDFIDFHRDVGIKVIAYSPLGNTNPTYDKKHGSLTPLLKDPFWTELAAKKNATPAQVVLAWGIQRGTVVIPKSTSEQHLRENIAAREITFTDEELAAVAARDKKARFLDPSRSWGYPLFVDLDDHTNLGEIDEL